jgi:diguanylate cyclase (GGDEF)-like protein
VVSATSSAILHKGSFYRVGGDEFCVRLINFSANEAQATAERIRTNIERLSPYGGSIGVTASIGVAVSDSSDVATPQALIRAADDAMYVAKWTTKNRVCVWPPSPAEKALADANRKKSMMIR